MKRIGFKQISMWLGVSLLTGLPVSAFAQQDVGLRMEVDKRQVEVGESLTLTIEFRQFSAGGNLMMGAPSISTPEHFEITGTSSGTSVSIANQQTVQISSTRLTLVATKPGTETLGPASLIYQDDQGKKKEIDSNVVTVDVVEKSGFSLFGKKKSNPPNSNPAAANPASTATDEGLRGLKPLLPESSVVLIILVVVILILIAGFAWRQTSKGGNTPPPVPPLEKAAQLREAWKKLAKEDLDSMDFCLGLSNLVRECLQYRFNFPAVDYTTEEILKVLKQNKLSDDEMTAAEKCLKSCDRVLYADGNLTGRDNLRTLCSSLLPKVQKS
jgi:hypothetical protein